MHSLKTGRLIASSVGVVLALGEVPEGETIPYRRFADELGVLFQIVDDILDVTGSDEELGKPSGSDERHGKLTYVSAYGLDRARELASQSHRKAREALAETDGQDRRPGPDHRLHPHPTHLMAKDSDDQQPERRLLDSIDSPDDLTELSDERAPAGSRRRCAS